MNETENEIGAQANPLSLKYPMALATGNLRVFITGGINEAKG